VVVGRVVVDAGVVVDAPTNVDGDGAMTCAAGRVRTIDRPTTPATTSAAATGIRSRCRCRDDIVGNTGESTRT
jgi:hypothetical protein